MAEIPDTFIKRLVVKNYRSLGEIDIALQPLTVFVGKNGTGKSNLIDVLRFVRDTLKDGFTEALDKRGGVNAIRCWFADKSEEIGIDITLQGHDWVADYGFAFASNQQGEGEIKSEHLSLNGREFEACEGQLMGADGGKVGNQSSQKCLLLPQLANSEPDVKTVYDFLLKMNFYDLPPSSLRQPQKIHQPFPLLENGANLASALHELHRRKEDYLITDALEVAVEGISGYRVERVGEQLVTQLHYNFQNGTSYEAYSNLRDEADGTLRLLGVLTALYQLRYPSVLGIEEPEKALYTDVLALLCDEFKNASWDYQVIITSHRPDLIDDLPLSSFLVVEKEPNTGMTEIGPLIQYQQEVINEKIFSPGELMQREGLFREGASLIVKV